ncbi:MAG: hypothetical protein L3J02_06135 [Henriciella sp.]|nr:hypothetical protein [Henriciella sp.]
MTDLAVPVEGLRAVPAVGVVCLRGDDADEARFVGRGELTRLGLWDETRRIIDAGRAIAQRQIEA